jgi:hypothetical protein
MSLVCMLCIMRRYHFFPLLNIVVVPVLILLELMFKVTVIPHTDTQQDAYNKDPKHIQLELRKT